MKLLLLPVHGADVIHVPWQTPSVWLATATMQQTLECVVQLRAEFDP